VDSDAIKWKEKSNGLNNLTKSLNVPYRYGTRGEISGTIIEWMCALQIFEGPESRAQAVWEEHRPRFRRKGVE